MVTYPTAISPPSTQLTPLILFRYALALEEASPSPSPSSSFRSHDWSELGLVGPFSLPVTGLVIRHVIKVWPRREGEKSIQRLLGKIFITLKKKKKILKKNIPSSAARYCHICVTFPELWNCEGS